MSKFPLFLLGFMLISYSNALFDETSPVQKITSAMEFARAYMSIDFLTAVFFYRNTPPAQSIEPVFTKFAKKTKDFYRFIAVDCDLVDQSENKQIIPACRDEIRDSLPQILFLEPLAERVDPKTKNPTEPLTHRYEGAANLEGFVNYAKKLMPNFSTRLASLEDHDNFLIEKSNLNKVLYITNKKSVPQYWKALTSKFRDNLAFGEILSKGYNIYEKYQLELFPAIIVLTKKDSSFERTAYQGEFDYESIEKFLNSFAETKTSESSTIVPDENSKEAAEKPSMKKVPIKKLLLESFEQSVYGTESLVLIHFFKGNEFHKTFSDVFSRFNEMIEIYNLNCTEADEQKFSQEILQIKSYPAYRLYPIGGKETKSKSKIIFSKNKKFKEIVRDISDLIDDPIISLDYMSLAYYMENVISTKKPALILFHNQDEISMSLRVLAQLERYKNWIRFANYKNPSDEIKTKFSIEKIPSILVAFIGDLDLEDLTIDDLQSAFYTGKLSYNELRHFIESFLPANIRSLTLSKKILQVDSSKEFKKLCQNKVQGCVIGLLDGFADNDYAEIRVKNELLVLENAKSNLGQKPISVVWIDGACHPEVLNTFDVASEQIPSLIYYDAFKKTITQLSGPYTPNNVDNFLKRALIEEDEAASTTLSDTPKFDGRICGIFHQERDSEILTKLSPSPRDQSLDIPLTASDAQKFKEIPADRDEL